MSSQITSEKLAQKEWLEAEGLGGFASGTAHGIRTRRYHALLLVATTPPTGRMVLVNGFDAWVETKSGKYVLSSQNYAPGIVGGRAGPSQENTSRIRKAPGRQAQTTKRNEGVPSPVSEPGIMPAELDTAFEWTMMRRCPQVSRGCS
jgi:hypothetical protein